MTDLASVGLKVDSSQVDKGVAKLDDLADAGERVDDSVKKTESATKSLNNTINSLVSALNNNTSATNSNTSAMSNNANAANKAASATKGTATATDELADRMNRLKASVQPFAAAQDQANAELAEARMLFEAGSLSAQEYAMYQSTLATRVQKYGEAQMRANTMIVNGGKAAKLTANEALNLSRQFADIGVTAAMGMNPLMILIQQGPQIYDVMKTSGLGIKDIGVEFLKTMGIVKEFEVVSAAGAGVSQAQAAANAEVAVTANAAAAAETRLAVASGEAATAQGAAAIAGQAQAAANDDITTAVKKTRVGMTGAGVALVAVAAAAATFVGIMSVGAKEISDGYGDVADKMGLTEKQMERLKESGVSTTVTLGDTLSAFFSVTGERLYDAFEGPITWMQETISDAYDAVVENTDWLIGEIIGIWFGGYRSIQATWSLLPGAIGDLAIQAANNTISAIEDMVNGAIELINKLTSQLPEGIADNFRIDSRASFGQFDNPYSGQAANASQVGGEAFAAGQQEGRGAYQRFKDDVSSRAIQNRRDAISEAAGDAEKGKKAGKSDAEKAYEKALKAAQDFLKALQQETAEIGKNRIEIKMMAVESAAAAAPTEALAKSIREAGQAWKTATFAEETRKYKEALSDLNEEQQFEISLLGMNVKERAVAEAQREIDIRMREYEREGIEINKAAIEAETKAILDNAAARGQLDLDAENARAYADQIARITDSVRDAGSYFDEAFGSEIGGMMDSLANYYDFQAEQEARLAEVRRTYGEESREYYEQQAEGAMEMARMENEAYENVISGVKNMFSEKSTAYKVMAAIEKTYAAIKLAMMVKEIVTEGLLTTTKVAGASTRMATDAVETTSSVANSTARGAADGVAAFAKTLASLPFPFNLVAGAAVLAALVSVGVKVAGGGGGGAKASAAAEADVGEAYNGPRDQYGNPTSHYSVLKPGDVTVAANGGQGYTRPNVGNDNGSGGFGSSISFGDVNLTVQGNANDDTLAEMQRTLDTHRKQTVEEARAAAARDRAAQNNRQHIGG